MSLYGEELLIELAEQTGTPIQAIALEVLAERQIIPDRMLLIGMQSKSRKTRHYAAAQMIHSSHNDVDFESLEEADRNSSSVFKLTASEPSLLDLRKLALAKSNREEIEELVLLGTSEGAAAYFVWADRYFADIADQVVLDIRNDFERLKDGFSVEIDKFVLSQIQDAPPEIQEAVQQQAQDFLKKRMTEFSKYRSFYVLRMKAEAFSVLAKRGSVDHFLLVIDKIKVEEFECREAAIKLISKFARRQDIPLIRSFLGEAYGEERAKLVRRMIDVAPELYPEILSSSSVDDVRVALRARFENDLAVSDEVYELLGRDAESFRIAGLMYLMLTLRQSDLLRLLTGYLDLPSYYYDVVTWIDRVVYAPDPLNKYFFEKLLTLSRLEISISYDTWSGREEGLEDKHPAHPN